MASKRFLEPLQGLRVSVSGLDRPTILNAIGLLLDACPHNHLIAMLTLHLDDPCSIVGIPFRLGGTRQMRTCPVGDVGKVFIVVTNQPKRNNGIVTDLTNPARCRSMANSACALTFFAMAPDPNMTFIPDLGAGAANTSIPYMLVIKPRHFAGYAVVAAGRLGKMVTPVCVAGDERRPPRLG